MVAVTVVAPPSLWWIVTSKCRCALLVHSVVLCLTWCLLKPSLPKQPNNHCYQVCPSNQATIVTRFTVADIDDMQRGELLGGKRISATLTREFSPISSNCSPISSNCTKIGRMSETPTTTTSQKSIVIRLPFVLQYASNLYCSTLVPLGSKERDKCQYSSHLYRSTPPICIAIRLPFVSQYFWENLGGCGHRDVAQKSGAEMPKLQCHCWGWFSSPINQKRSGDPNPQYFSKSTAVQMGGVLPYKWERTAVLPFLRSLEARKVRRYKGGAYCRTKWRCTAVLFRQVVGVGVSETLPN